MHAPLSASASCARICISARSITAASASTPALPPSSACRVSVGRFASSQVMVAAPPWPSMTTNRDGGWAPLPLPLPPLSGCSTRTPSSMGALAATATLLCATTTVDSFAGNAVVQFAGSATRAGVRREGAVCRTHNGRTHNSALCVSPPARWRA